MATLPLCLAMKDELYCRTAYIVRRNSVAQPAEFVRLQTVNRSRSILIRSPDRPPVLRAKGTGRTGTEKYKKGLSYTFDMIC